LYLVTETTTSAEGNADLGDQFRFDQHFVGVRIAEVAVDVSAAFVDIGYVNDFSFTRQS
jgi:hypothetical protein